MTPVVVLKHPSSASENRISLFSMSSGLFIYIFNGRKNGSSSSKTTLKLIYLQCSQLVSNKANGCQKNQFDAQSERQYSFRHVQDASENLFTRLFGLFCLIKKIIGP